MKAPIKFVLPLFRQIAGTNNQATLQIAAGNQFLDEQPRHDGLAGAGVIGQKEAQRLPRKHVAVDGGDLVRQRFNQGRVHRQQGIEQISQLNAPGLRH